MPRLKVAASAFGAAALGVLAFTANVLGVADWVKVNLLNERVITSSEEPLGADPREVVVSGDRLPPEEALWIVAENVQGLLYPLTEARYRAAEEEYAATLRSEQFGPDPQALTVHIVIADRTTSDRFYDYFDEAALDPITYENGIGTEWPDGAQIIDSFP